MHDARPLRVALLMGTDGPGGAEMMVFRLACALRTQGCTVVPVLPAGGYGWLGGLLRGAGFEPVEVVLSTRWFDVACVRHLIRIFRAHSIDVVHSHEFDFALLGSAAARLSRVPHVITLHGGLTATRTFRRRAALRWAMRRSAGTVAVSAATRDRFAADLGVGVDAFTVIANGVPVTPGDPSAVRAEFGCTADDVVLLAVGTLERNKGHHVLIDALHQLGERRIASPWKLIIAGGRGGDQHGALIDLVRARGLDGRVHIVTNRDDVADLLALAHVFVMPSFVEGLPMALLEAMVAGKAVVASATGGIPEAVADGTEGVLVPPGDAMALAAALEPLMQNPERRAALGLAASARARREFTVDVMAGRYHTLYAQVCTRRTGAPPTHQHATQMQTGSPAPEAEERREAERHDRLYREKRPANLAMRPSDWERFDDPGEPLNSYAASVVALGDLHGRKVLDVGCGDGWYSVILARRGGTVWGFDISSSAIDTARDRAAQNDVADRTHFDVASAYHLPYPDHFFDVVTGQAVLHHLGDKERLARELRRVMRPGAIAVFSEPFAGVRWLRHVRKLVPVPSQAPDDPDQQQMTYGDVDEFRRYFEVDVEEFQLLARLERVIRSGRTVAFLKRFDRAALRRIPFLRRYARSIVVTLRTPNVAIAQGGRGAIV